MRRKGIKRILDGVAMNLKDAVSLGPSFPLRHISGLLGRKYHVSTIKNAGKVHIRSRSLDASTFIEIFRGKAYDLSGLAQFPHVMANYQRILDAKQIPIIIDAGANVGAASIWFARQFPEARIIAIEPDADNAEVCRLNTGRLPNVKVIEAVIGSEHGQVSLSNPANRSDSVQTARSEGGKIPMRTISELVLEEQYQKQLFLVKIDIEGFEDNLFAKNTEWIDEAEVIIIESHDWLFPGKGKSRNFQKAIADREFEILISGENLIYIRLPTVS